MLTGHLKYFRLNISDFDEATYHGTAVYDQQMAALPCDMYYPNISDSVAFNGSLNRAVGIIFFTMYKVLQADIAQIPSNTKSNMNFHGSLSLLLCACGQQGHINGTISGSKKLPVHDN